MLFLPRQAWSNSVFCLDNKGFALHEGKCRFNGCMHVSEPGCAVKQAVEDGIINYDRYKSYTDIFEEIKNKKKY